MAQAPPQVGDPVTILWALRAAGVRYGRVVLLGINDKIVITLEGDPDGGEITDHLYNEGNFWIRGHHPPDSPEVRAMQAAWALL